MMFCQIIKGQRSKTHRNLILRCETLYKYTKSNRKRAVVALELRKRMRKIFNA